MNIKAVREGKLQGFLDIREFTSYQVRGYNTSPGV